MFNYKNHELFSDFSVRSGVAGGNERRLMMILILVSLFLALSLAISKIHPIFAADLTFLSNDGSDCRIYNIDLTEFTNLKSY